MNDARKKALVVDDEQEIVDFLEHFLRRFNFDVIKINKGQEALAAYREHKPDYVFLDIQMPDKDGIAVLEELRAADASLKVIMITGKDDKKCQQKAKKCGALDYITKPLDLHELRQKVEMYIGNP
ncbi:MAG: response regulator [Candidatus Omnitrophota bacterium]